jgi:CRISPR-associated protein Cmr3
MTNITTTTTACHRFLEPLDVLFLRGNQLFGDAGSFGESMIPPWPSVAAGALRSQILSEQGIDLAAFSRGEIIHPELGSPAAPGSFAITGFKLARKLSNGTIETLHQIPSDLALTKDKTKDPGFEFRRIRPEPIPRSLASSCKHLQWPILSEPDRSKPVSGYWMTAQGWEDYLNGRAVDIHRGLVDTSKLWGMESRIGIGLNESTRSAEDGKLFTSQALAFHPGIGFLASIVGVSVPENGMVRLGGDGRAARSLAVNFIEPKIDVKRILQERRCRIVLTTPGLFSQGWLPEGFKKDKNGYTVLDLCGVHGRLVCAAVPRAETVSGWDLAKWQPKDALQAAPIGSVYWIDELDATEESLSKLAESGLWDEICHDSHRRAEGFNRFTFAVY